MTQSVEGQQRAPLLSLRGINKSFGAVQVLHGVDLDVAPGEVTALVGDNGAGKSTLIKCIAGIHPFDDGEMIFEGRPVTIHGPIGAKVSHPLPLSHCPPRSSWYSRSETSLTTQ